MPQSTDDDEVDLVTKEDREDLFGRDLLGHTFGGALLNVGEFNVFAELGTESRYGRTTVCDRAYDAEAKLCFRSLGVGDPVCAGCFEATLAEEPS